MIFSRLPIIRSMHRPWISQSAAPEQVSEAMRKADEAAGEFARRWSRAARDQPELVNDLIRISGLLELPPERLVNGVVQPDPIDPIRMAQERGVQLLAKQLLAACQISTQELNQLMENDDE